jgi:hypothetical protein
MFARTGQTKQLKLLAISAKKKDGQTNRRHLPFFNIYLAFGLILFDAATQPNGVGIYKQIP